MTPNELLIAGEQNYRLAGWKYNSTIRLFLFIMLLLIFYFSLSGNLVPKRYDILANTYSEKTILAPKQVENTVQTEKARENAATQIETIYRIIPTRNEQIIDTVFDKLLQNNTISEQDLKFDEKVSLYRAVFPSVMEDYTDQLMKNLRQDQQFNDTLIAEIKTKLGEQQYKISEDTYFKLPRLTKDDLQAMLPVAKGIVAKLTVDPIIDVQAIRSKVTELVNSSVLSKASMREAVQEIAKFAIMANKFEDAKATDLARTRAREETKLIYINKNEVLVNKNQLITDDIYNRLKSLNLLKSKVNYLPQLGLLLLSLLFVLVLYLTIRQSKLSIRENNSQLAMFVIIVILNIAVMHIVALGTNLDYPYIGFLTPVALGSILMMILLDAPLALISSLLFSIIGSIIFNSEPNQLFDFRYGLVWLAVCYASIFSLNRASQRLTILRAGITNSAFSVLAVVSLLLLDNQYSIKDATFALSFAAAGGILTAVLVIGILPFFEALFGILSPLKLIELSNPHLFLLRKLLTETPGTYHHSVMVGNLSEAAAEAIGADGLLCRVGAYYHDIGKTRRPSYFIENQSNMENPHDFIEPGLSKSIIIAHTRDGVEMLKEHKIPKPIRDIAEQHHGTSLLIYFYHKAMQKLEESGGAEVSEEDFRYPGPKAQSKEAAIVGIADSVEAAVRSLRHPTMEQIDAMVEKIIKQRLDDGQFNDCDLTLKELQTIGKALRETLLGIFHSRIEYPNDLPQN